MKLTKPQIATIYDFCKPFLHDINYKISDYPLYRGMSTRKETQKYLNDFYIMDGCRGDRKPRNTPIELHNSFNDVLLTKFGYKFRNGLFVSGNWTHAQPYGEKVYNVFPMGEYKFCWSYKYEDASMFLDYPDVDLNNIIEYYNNTDIKWAIGTGHEIMLYCDKCLVVESKVDSI